jgi:ARG/rhodanese/phosphatase superfamily protein
MLTATFDLPDTLKSVEVGGHQQYEALEVFHLRWASDGNALDYLTLDEALEGKWIEVAESSENGAVPEIKIINRSNRMVFLMAGEQVIGCKQNRVLNASIMVSGNSEIPLPVTCVEGGRWGYKSPIFSSGYTSSHYHLRAMMDRQASQSYKFAGAPRTDQAAVWSEVSRKLSAVGSRSPSSELQAMYRDYDCKLAEAMKQLPAPEGFHGAVFTVAGRIAGADLFDKPETFRKLWPKLVRSSVIDSFEASTESPSLTAMQDVAAWLERSTRATPTKYPSPGIGQDIRLEGQDMFGAGLVVEDHPVHVELFCSVRRVGSRPDSTPEREATQGRRVASEDVPVANESGQGDGWLNPPFS